MAKLSDRLVVIARNINRGETVADIGTDHGYLPLFLYENDISKKVIMTDISAPSLRKGEKVCCEYLVDSNEKVGIDARHGDGMEPIGNGEVDVIVIAGMGGVLISHIIGADITKSATYKKYILQPRTAVAELRCFLDKNGYEILKEELVKEGKYICEIIVARPSEKVEEDIKDIHFEGYEEEMAYELPPYYEDMEGDLVDEYLARKLEKYQKIQRGIGKSKKDRDLSYKEREVSYKIEYIRQMISKR